MSAGISWFVHIGSSLPKSWSVTTTEDGRDDGCLLYACCLTDQQWELIEPLLPVARRGRPRIHSLRLVLDTIWYALRTGCAWRLAPNDLVPWHAAYRYFRSWTRQGVWADIHDALRDQVRTAAGRNPAPTAAVLDSQPSNHRKVVSRSAGTRGIMLTSWLCRLGQRGPGHEVAAGGAGRHIRAPI